MSRARVRATRVYFQVEFELENTLLVKLARFIELQLNYTFTLLYKYNYLITYKSSRSELDISSVHRVRDLNVKIIELESSFELEFYITFRATATATAAAAAATATASTNTIIPPPLLLLLLLPITS